MILIMLSILAGIGTALIGSVTSPLLAKIAFSGLPYDSALIAGWIMYLCVVIVVCAGVILSKAKKE